MIFRLNRDPDITNDLPPLTFHDSVGQGLRDDATNQNGAILAGVRSWDVGNETCTPFPFPIGMDIAETDLMTDQRQYYPGNAGEDYSPLTPALIPQRLGLTQILRLK